MSTTEEVDLGVRAEILAVEARRQQALIEGDLETLDELFDEELVHIHAPGLTHTKAQLLEHVGTRRAYLDMSRGELSIRTVGDVVIMTGPITNRLRNPDGSERTLSGVATQVLRRGADGAWRFVSFQMTPMGEQVWGALPSEVAPDGEEQA
ncbi:YybH family protein [Microbacterium oxydans]|uniref:YybH family protein n=1 Tax=Microbacterium oxydans TaxID=82380 RepID=UPI00226BAB87|nr:nuclear transport factor 2 family protein [Microbacterium oxydans]WAA66517.1 nuclear transport factor 2 family protein [Microbacterium oxydans]